MLKTVQISSIDSLSFIEQLQKLIEQAKAKLHLVVHPLLGEEEWAQFAEFITSQKPFSIQKLSLQIDQVTLNNLHFLECIKRLNATSLASLELIFSDEELAQSAAKITRELTEHVAPLVSYPVHVNQADKLTLDKFQRQVIAAIQKRHNEQTDKDSTQEDNSTSIRKRTLDPKDPLAKKIRLKELIAHNQLHDKNRGQYIDVEVEYVETVEQQIAQEEVIEVHAEVQLNEIQPYLGQLIDFAKFEEPIYKNKVEEVTGSASRTNYLYSILKQELFANLPQAIKYISPLAAEQFAANLPALLSLNKDNLPHGFLLKQTNLGELVLDYDPYLENEKANPFTPAGEVPELAAKPIYNIELAEHDVEQWINNPTMFASLCSRHPYNTPEQLSNLWIKYGHEGVRSFFQNLNEHTAVVPGLAEFMFIHYVLPLPQWDHLYKNKSFFNSLQRISHYEENKLACFQRFIQDAGSSHHDLHQTVAAFEVFWSELNLLCTENKVARDAFDQANWTTPGGGNPVVYMERLLTVLKNARDLHDQFKGLHQLSLSNYGAYYASKYEGFKSVSAVMKLEYDVEAQKQRAFNKNFHLYQVDLDSLYNVITQGAIYKEHARWASRLAKFYWLINCAEELPQPLDLKQLQNAGLAIPFTEKDFIPPYKFYFVGEDERLSLLLDEKPPFVQTDDCYALGYRFIGLQASGITVSSFCEQVEQYMMHIFGGYSFASQLLGTLFFVSHERYAGTPLTKILSSLNHASVHHEVIDSALALLKQLYTLDIKLNEVEGFILFESIAGMNSAEFEGLGLDKEECIKKLLHQLQQNKFATFKLFDFRAKGGSSPKWPFLYALDTAEFLAQDPLVAAVYHDDLLLFSGLINSESKDVYFHARKEPQVLANLEKVKGYLHQAAMEEKPNNLHYAVQIMLHSQSIFSYAQFLKVCGEINALSTFDNKAVDKLLNANGFRAGAQLPEVFNKDNADIKALMIQLIIRLDCIKTATPHYERHTLSPLYHELTSRSITELQVQLQGLWNDVGVLASVVERLFFSKALKTLKDILLTDAFSNSASDLVRGIGQRIRDLPDFQDHGDFDKVNRMNNEAQTIALLVKHLVQNPFVIEHEKEFIATFERMDFSKIDYETLFALLTLLTTMPQKNYLILLNTLFADVRFMSKKAFVLELIGHLSCLNASYFPVEYLDVFTKMLIANPDAKDWTQVRLNMIRVYEKDNKDPLLEMIMSSTAMSSAQICDVLNVTEEVTNYREEFSQLLTGLVAENKLNAVLAQLKTTTADARVLILEIISKGHVLNQTNALNKPSVDYKDLLTELAALSPENLAHLHAFYESTPISSDCLFNALKNPQRPREFMAFLLDFEKTPFGERNFDAQFSIAEVERVINQGKDLLNDSAYTYQYRKQLMEAFLFVNEIGKSLPVYHNKAAKDLTNAEISALFIDIKQGGFADLTPFQRRLLALGLMREAMYRSTGEFPYSTQIITLIDGLMHQGDFISNIDTGQGKSLIDSMKAALLWLDSDRVDLTTSSLVDAKRDIVGYGPFLKLLGIPYSETAINSASAPQAFKTNGINFSTFAQLSLFFAKAKVMGVPLETPATQVSLVTNESDYAVLDDRIIYRFATADGSGVGYGQEWVYKVINDFVTQPGYRENNKTTAGEDVDDLKAYLIAQGNALKKSTKIVDKFSDAQYLSWLEAALTVNYVLKENEDYVIPDEFEKKTINGVELRSRVVKILMHDGNVSADSTFGNGMQQLLYARLNKERGSADFVIEPQNKTILSANNKNLMDYYLAKKGFIWGSSGTVGSPAEIEEQHAKYGFEFGKAEPHQKNKVKFNTPEFFADEEAQFKALIRQLTRSNPSDNRSPSIVFCKDINTATKLFNRLKQNNGKGFPLQLYTGLGREEQFINNAKKPGMITITSALGRNTDIHYNKIHGLHVWHTYVDSIRGTGQKSGRTGRQGSAGEVHYLFNSKELGSKSVAQIRAQIDANAARERSINEELYNVLGYLLRQIDAIPVEHFTQGKNAFLRESWSQFSTTIETRFQESRREAAYNKDEFVQETLADFNHMMNVALNVPVAEMPLSSVLRVLEQKQPMKTTYRPFTEAVKIRDCTPPIAIAYHLLQVHETDATPEETKQGIKAKLSKLFAQLGRNNFTAESTNYLRYLVANPSTKAVIVAAHKEFLSEYLQHHSQKLNVVQRWLGYEGKLNKIARNQHYLLMFHAFASIPNQSTVELATIKNTVTTLLDEYLETCWFINKERKNWALALKEQINNANDVDAIISLLAQSQIAVAKADIKRNETSLKPIHFFGESRFQKILSRATELAASLSAKTDIPELINGLTPLASQVTDNISLTALTVDELKERASAKKKDRANAAVTLSALEQAMNIKNRQGPTGMIGRKGFFNSIQEEPTSIDEKKDTDSEPFVKF